MDLIIFKLREHLKKIQAVYIDASVYDFSTKYSIQVLMVPHKSESLISLPKINAFNNSLVHQGLKFILDFYLHKCKNKKL